MYTAIKTFNGLLSYIISDKTSIGEDLTGAAHGIRKQKHIPITIRKSRMVLTSGHPRLG